MNYQIDTAALLRRFYGIAPQPYRIDAPPRTTADDGGYRPVVIERETDALGQPVLDAVAIEPFEYNVQTGGDFELQTFDGLQLPRATMTTVQQRKHIVTTRVQGRSGTVKEFISDGDFTVRFQGLMLDSDPAGYVVRDETPPTTSDHPDAQLARLAEALAVPAALPVQSGYLNKLGIYHLVVTDYEFGPAAFENARPFTITALSDRSFDIRSLDQPYDPNL